MHSNYLQSATKQFEYYKLLGERTFEQLTEEELFWQYNEESNSIAVIVHHLWGNMKSRWTDFLTADGEKEWRERDKEFENVIQNKVELLQKWEDGWSFLFQALDSVDASNFEKKVYIRNQAHTIVDAVNRQMCHYASHVGQIMFIGKMLKGTNWKSLSIPKGASKEFNRKKMSEGKHEGHFTDDLK